MPTDASPTRVARQAQMRDQNLAVTLRTVVEASAPLSRAQVATRTGLARATVTGLVDQLVEARLVRELEPTQTQRAGRPAVPLVPQRGTVAGLGLEVNVDYLGVVAIDLSGEVLAEHVELDDLRGSEPGAVLDRLADMTAGVIDGLDTAHVAGTMLALPGLVDRAGGPLRAAPHLRWRDVDVLGRLTAHPVLAAHPPRLANEAKLAARAEARARPGEHENSFVYVSGEVGIGGAIVLDGELFAGGRGWSGEIGHIVVDAFSAGDGSLEALAGQDAMLRASGLPSTSRLGVLLEALEAGDPRAAAAVERAARALGVALSAVANVVDVGDVVLGGTFGQLFDHVHDEVAARLDELVIFAPWAPLTVSQARAGAYPAMVGGALAVLAGVVADPAEWLREQASAAH